MCTCGSNHASTATQTAPVGASFKVEDMTCGHCVGVIRSALTTGLPGAEVSVDLATQTVTVAGDADRAEAIIRDAGYEPKLLVH